MLVNYDAGHFPQIDSCQLRFVFLEDPIESHIQLHFLPLSQDKLAERFIDLRVRLYLIVELLEVRFVQVTDVPPGHHHL